MQAHRRGLFSALFLPVLQPRHNGFHVRADLLSGPRFARHMLHAEVDELLQAGVLERTARVAPLAVVLVERAVRLAAENGVLQRHPAALTDELARRAQQCVDRNVKKLREQLQRLGIRRRFAGLPARDRLPRHKDALGDLLLRKPLLRSEREQNILRFHVHQLLMQSLPHPAPRNKQHAVAPGEFIKTPRQRHITSSRFTITCYFPKSAVPFLVNSEE